jgi:hypothetical protein
MTGVCHHASSLFVEMELDNFIFAHGGVELQTSLSLLLSCWDLQACATMLSFKINYLPG